VSTLIYWQDDATGQTETVQFDAVTALAPEDPATITDHPVERGANVVDHIRDEPERLTIEAKISMMPNVALDTDAGFAPLDIQVFSAPAGATKQLTLEVPSPPIQPDANGLLTAGIAAAGNALFGGPTATVNQPRQGTALTVQATAFQQRSPRNRVRDVYEKLLDVKSKHLLLSVQTRDRDYFDMAIERLAAPRSVDEGSATKFTIDLKRIKVAASETVQAPKPAEARGNTTKNKGSQAPKEVENPVPAQSLLSGLTGIGADTPTVN
jgi:hypothetical protein